MPYALRLTPVPLENTFVLIILFFEHIDSIRIGVRVKRVLRTIFAAIPNANESICCVLGHWMKKECEKCK